ncbi:hypothetical protein HME9304_03230 [Flagellimonas maritima]|uniref:Uncharacterized protein n=1 Tax=Flagellimonas maritima TaxID=1383885 RepID=A0A2Z4LXW1_9FLAO|nr:hypothetical protein HME9304_03230 [Allomuricauda aurantiaca]
MKRVVFFFVIIFMIYHVSRAQHENITKNWKTVSISDIPYAKVWTD